VKSVVGDEKFSKVVEPTASPLASGTGLVCTAGTPDSVVGPARSTGLTRAGFGSKTRATRMTATLTTTGR
jgi:hypothetical protein